MFYRERLTTLSASHRRLIEIASKSNNLLLETSSLMDAQIATAQRNARHYQKGRIPDFSETIAYLTYQAEQAIEIADMKPGVAPRNDYYRLVSQTAFLEQQLQAPFAFEKPQYWKERADLTNGLYGVSAQILSEAINEYDTSANSRIQKAELLGVIQEQTFLALFNREQQRNRIAIPSGSCADMFNKTDVDVWVLPDRQNEPFHLPVQIKSSHRQRNDKSSPKGGITITGSDFNNEHTLHISRLIVKDDTYMTGVGDALSDEEEQQIQRAGRVLLLTMEHRSGRSI